MEMYRTEWEGWSLVRAQLKLQKEGSENRVGPSSKNKRDTPATGLRSTKDLKQDKQKHIPRHTTMRVHNTRRAGNLKSIQRWGRSDSGKEASVRPTADFSKAAMETKGQWSGIFNVLREITTSTKSTPSENIFKIEGKIKTYSGKKKHRLFFHQMVI